MYAVIKFFKKPKRANIYQIHSTSLQIIHEIRRLKVKVLFVQNRNKKSEWLAILSTDCTLSKQEIERIYGFLKKSNKTNCGKGKVIPFLFLFYNML